MAIAYETSLAPTAVQFLTAGETETIAFNAGTGTNRVLLVCVQWVDQNNTLTGVTYNGVSMTSMGTQITQGAIKMQLWRLAGPASGSNNLAVTMGAGDNNSNALIAAWVANGVDQTTPTDGYTTNQGTASTANIVSTLTITSATNDYIAVFYGSYNGTATIAATPTNYTERQDGNNAVGLTLEFGDAAGAASVATSATWDNGAFTVDWIALGCNLNQASTSRKVIIGPKP